MNERFKRSADQSRLDDRDVVLADHDARGSLLGKVTPNVVNPWMRRPRLNVGTIRIAAGRSGRVPIGGKIHCLQLSVVTGMTPLIDRGRVQFDGPARKHPDASYAKPSQSLDGSLPSRETSYQGSVTGNSTLILGWRIIR